MSTDLLLRFSIQLIVTEPQAKGVRSYTQPFIQIYKAYQYHPMHSYIPPRTINDLSPAPAPYGLVPRQNLE